MDGIKETIMQLTTEEKIRLVMGKGFWNTFPLERLNIPSVEMADSPSGLRKQTGISDHMGFNDSLPAVNYPCGSAIASTWNCDLIERLGVYLGEECHVQNVHILLGPAINIKRHPQNGRNMEYFSEDPYLNGEIAKAYVRGLESVGVAACIKHYACNNQEKGRQMVDTSVDERTLREIYLYAFETCIRECNPGALMTAYNQVNGSYCSQNEILLKKILRDTFGYKGLVMSDWNGTYDSARAHQHGLDLEMPCGFSESEKNMSEALACKTLTMEALDTAAGHVIENVRRIHQRWNNYKISEIDWEAHHRLAYEIAVEGAVLLKNDSDALPLKSGERIAVIGNFARDMCTQVGGSAKVHEIRKEIPLEWIKRNAGVPEAILFAPGRNSENICDDVSLAEACKISHEADKTVIFAGLIQNGEGETVDRKNLDIDPEDIKLIEACSCVQKKVIVVLCCGGSVVMPWLSKVDAVLDMHLGGQAAGWAAADLLYGIVNPSGKLSETFPLCVENTPAYLNYPGINNAVSYKEGVFVGYRYYDTKKIKTLFPFGHGLSYTSFEYSDLSVNRHCINDSETMKLSVCVANCGNRGGKTTVQVYVHDIKSKVMRPCKELKAFHKLYLEPGEKQTVELTLGKNAFAYYEPEIHDWYVEGGLFQLLVGESAEDIRLIENVEVYPVNPMPLCYTLQSGMSDMLMDDRCSDKIVKILELLLDLSESETLPFTREQRYSAMLGSSLAGAAALLPNPADFDCEKCIKYINGLDDYL